MVYFLANGLTLSYESMLRISNFGNPERFAKGLRVFTLRHESMLRISNFGNPERFAKGPNVQRLASKVY
jgi:hypothetical protein